MHFFCCPARPPATASLRQPITGTKIGSFLQTKPCMLKIIKQCRCLSPYALIVLCLTVILTACSASKEGRTLKRSINGSWTLQTINTEGITEKFAAKVFNEADLNCFIGSTWNLVSNNSSGSYTLVGGQSVCSTLQRNIRWSIYEPKDTPREFQFKRLDGKNQPMDDNDGFRLNISKLDGSKMQLTSAITFEGKPGYIVYNFTKK